MIHSHSLIFSDFDTKWYKRWAKELKQDSPKYLEDHQLRANKFWQNAVMAEALHEHGMLKKGQTAIGFGVGRERLPALFAKHGVKVTATDQDFRTKKAKHWQKHELATGTESLNKLLICPPAAFKEKVEYRALDMKKVPASLHGKYDFVWSNCALGHLGSIDEGLRFIVESAKCLKPGGVAVHTTEINVLFNKHTLSVHPETVIFRPKDIHRLYTMLKKESLELDPLDLNFGNSQADAHVEMKPEFGNAHSKLQVGGYLLTQIILVIRRPKKTNAVLSASRSQRENRLYARNVLRQKQFALNNRFVRSVVKSQLRPLGKGQLKAIKPAINVTLTGKPKYVYVEFENTTSRPFFSAPYRFVAIKPIALATAGPADRESVFAADDWFKYLNRPSTFLYEKNSAGKWEEVAYIKPRSKFAFRLQLDPKKGKKDTSYIEKFALVQEGKIFLQDTTVTITVKVS